MNLLVDQNLSPRVAELLTKGGHDAVHVRDLGAASASDFDIIDLANADGRTIVSADTDFGALLAQSRATKPSVILVKDIMELRPTDLANLLLGHFDVLEPHLQAGAIAAFSPTGIRVRALPLR